MTKALHISFFLNVSLPFMQILWLTGHGMTNSQTPSPKHKTPLLEVFRHQCWHLQMQSDSDSHSSPKVLQALNFSGSGKGSRLFDIFAEAFASTLVYKSVVKR